ncbi:MAG: acetyl-CoA C-acetyltransferase [Bacteroidales bacterium]|jgi:acetyl-CoA C-acetyltransferase|nr:acetyl-CoA C-acetyltransferase [Bacteroidales bacterium]
MKKVFIVSAKRTAVGKFLGSLTNFTAPELAAEVIKNIISETKIDPSKIDEVIVGNVLSAGQKQGVARQCAIKGGIPDTVSAYSINMVCGSGLKAINNAYTSIIAGQSELILAGGTETMSGAVYLLPPTVRTGVKMGDFNIIDHMIIDGLTDAFNNYHMGITAENVAEKYDISREEQDEFSYSSQIKAMKAQDEGKFDNEIVTIEIVAKKETTIFNKDEFINRTTSPEKLAKLKPAFKKDGTVTAGNASGINDGASFVLVASEDAVKKYNLKPLVEIIAIGQGGVPPEIMGVGPVPAVDNALKNANLKLSEIDIFELNEAFAAQSLAVMKLLTEEHKVDKKFFQERANKNGGAIALGHPIGASGNRITVSLIHEMKRKNNNLGLASLCIGGGMGVAIILKNVN